MQSSGVSRARTTGCVHAHILFSTNCLFACYNFSCAAIIILPFQFFPCNAPSWSRPTSLCKLLLGNRTILTWSDWLELLLGSCGKVNDLLPTACSVKGIIRLKLEANTWLWNNTHTIKQATHTIIDRSAQHFRKVMRPAAGKVPFSSLGSLTVLGWCAFPASCMKMETGGKNKNYWRKKFVPSLAGVVFLDIDHVQN